MCLCSVEVDLHSLHKLWIRFLVCVCVSDSERERERDVEYSVFCVWSVCLCKCLCVRACCPAYTHTQVSVNSIFIFHSTLVFIVLDQVANLTL